MARRFLSSFAAITILLLLTENAYATYEIVEIEKPFYVRSLAGEALDPTGAPVSGVEVSDCDQGFTKVITATRSDEKGRFILPVRGVSVHYLELSGSWIQSLAYNCDDPNHRPEAITYQTSDWWLAQITGRHAISWKQKPGKTIDHVSIQVLDSCRARRAAS